MVLIHLLLTAKEQIADSSHKQSSTEKETSSFISNLKAYAENAYEICHFYLIEFHNLLLNKLNVEYPLDLVIFMLLGYMLSFLFGKLFSSEVRIFY